MRLVSLDLHRENEKRGKFFRWMHRLMSNWSYIEIAQYMLKTFRHVLYNFCNSTRERLRSPDDYLIKVKALREPKALCLQYVFSVHLLKDCVLLYSYNLVLKLVSDGVNRLRTEKLMGSTRRWAREQLFKSPTFRFIWKHLQGSTKTGDIWHSFKEHQDI